MNRALISLTGRVWEPTGLTQVPLTLEASSLTQAHLQPSDETLQGYAPRLTADTPP
jgi:hypothetical protein